MAYNWQSTMQQQGTGTVAAENQAGMDPSLSTALKTYGTVGASGGGVDNTNFNFSTNAQQDAQAGTPGNENKPAHAKDIPGGLVYADQSGDVAYDQYGNVYYRVKGNNGDAGLWVAAGSNTDITGTGSYLGVSGGSVGSIANYHTYINQGQESTDLLNAQKNSQAFKKQAASFGQSSATSTPPTTPTTVTPAAPTIAASPTNDSFLQQLQQQQASGQTAALTASQNTATQTGNLLRLAAGAGTLGGNVGALESAGSGQAFLQNQQAVQSTNTAQATAATQTSQMIGNELTSDSNNLLTATTQSVQATFNNINDEITALQNEFKNASGQQALQIQQYTQQLQTQMQAYQNAVNQYGASSSQAQTIAKGVIAGVGALVAIFA